MSAVVFRDRQSGAAIDVHFPQTTTSALELLDDVTCPPLPEGYFFAAIAERAALFDENLVKSGGRIVIVRLRAEVNFCEWGDLGRPMSLAWVPAIHAEFAVVKLVLR